jgi:cyanophycinase-like exopeptidase
MGSGETAPTMVRPHREVFGRTPAGPAVFIDTPFAFQTNRLDLVAKTRRYFAESVGREIEVLHWPPLTDDPVAADRALALLDGATWVFAGPGSPTYALRSWRASPIPAAIETVAGRGGTVVFGSAGAVTAGAYALPVYEVYKAGADPYWEAGLDLLGRLAGLCAAVVPHFDNREGGQYDTRYCYVGESRLAVLEGQLPGDVGVLGVDEHTAVELDTSAGSVTVTGSGRMSLRHRDRTTVVPAGEVWTLDDVRGVLAGTAVGVAQTGPTATPSVPDAAASAVEAPATSLRDETERARRAFDAALARRDASGCVAAVLGLEEALVRWSTDMLQSADGDEARRTLRALIVRLGSLAEGGLADPAELVRPYVDLLLALRDRAREARDFATADEVRERLAEAGIEVRDSGEGSGWLLRPG